jgi:hypothetical protein
MHGIREAWSVTGMVSPLDDLALFDAESLPVSMAFGDFDPAHEVELALEGIADLLLGGVPSVRVDGVGVEATTEPRILWGKDWWEGIETG